MAEIAYLFHKDYLTDASGQKYFASPYLQRVQDTDVQGRIAALAAGWVTNVTALQNVPEQLSDIGAMVTLDNIAWYETETDREASSPAYGDVSFVYNDASAANNVLKIWTSGSPDAWVETTFQMASAADLAAKADAARTIAGAGLATGGGDLTGDRTITVPASSTEQAEAGTDEATAMTPARVKESVDFRTQAVRADVAALMERLKDEVGVDGYEIALAIAAGGLAAFGFGRDGVFYANKFRGFEGVGVGEHPYVIHDSNLRIAFAIRDDGRVILLRDNETVVESDDTNFVWALGAVGGRSPLLIDRNGRTIALLREDWAARNVEQVMPLDAVAAINSPAGHVLQTFKRSDGLIDYLADVGRVVRLRQRNSADATASVGVASGTLTCILHNGQSLGAGGGASGSGDVLTPTPLRPGINLMLNTGARGPQDTAYVWSDGTDFASIYNVFASDKAETQEPRMFSYWSWREMCEGEPLSTLVAINACDGGEEIEDLDKGSDPYQNLLVMLLKARDLAVNTYGLDGVDAPCHFWTQGESDALNETLSSYQTYLETYHSDLKTDVASILQAPLATLVSNVETSTATLVSYLASYTPDAIDLPMIVDQMATRDTGIGYEVSLAQLEASRDNADIHLSTPKYFLPYIDTVHLTKEGYALLGEYNARCARRVLAGQTWTGLRPTSVTRSGAVITVAFDIPENGSLAWDTTTLPAGEADDYGFVYEVETGTAPAISSVAIVGNTVEVTLASTPSGVTGETLSYAYDGPGDGGGSGIAPGAWGNLKSTSRDPSQYYPDRMLDHWCVVFKDSVTV